MTHEHRSLDASCASKPAWRRLQKAKHPLNPDCSRLLHSRGKPKDPSRLPINISAHTFVIYEGKATLLQKPWRVRSSSACKPQGCSHPLQVTGAEGPAERREAVGFVQKNQETPAFERHWKRHPTCSPPPATRSCCVWLPGCSEEEAGLECQGGEHGQGWVGVKMELGILLERLTSGSARVFGGGTLGCDVPWLCCTSLGTCT